MKNDGTCFACTAVGEEAAHLSAGGQPGFQNAIRHQGDSLLLYSSFVLRATGSHVGSLAAQELPQGTEGRQTWLDDSRENTQLVPAYWLSCCEAGKLGHADCSGASQTWLSK